MDFSRQNERVELIYTSDPHTNLKPGDQGTYFGMDDMRQHMINWDNDSNLSMIPGEDSIKFLKK